MIPTDIRKIYPSFELLSPADPDADATSADGVVSATQATATATAATGTITAVVDVNGSYYTNAPKVTIAPPDSVAEQVNSSATVTFTGIPANNKKITLDGTDITFGDMSVTSDIKTDIVGSSLIAAAAASGTVTIDSTPNSALAGVSLTIDGTTLTEGVDFVRGGTNAECATNLAAAIDNLADFTASASGSDIAVVAAATGAAGNVALSSSDAAKVQVPANLSGGVTAVAAGDAKDDLAATFAQFVSGMPNFTASSAGNVVTIESTIDNGTDPAASPAGDATTLSTNISGSNVTLTLFQGGTIAARGAVGVAVLGDPTDATLKGTVVSINLTDAGSGYSADPTITIEAPEANVIDQIAKAGAQAAVGAGTFAYTEKYVAISLSDLLISGSNPNALTETEASASAGDFRKFSYHVTRKLWEYMHSLEQLISITITAPGSSYQTGDTFTIAGIDGTGTLVCDTTTGAITDVQWPDASDASLLTGVNTTVRLGSNLSVAPNISLQTATGSGGNLTAILSADSPGKYTVAKGNISENNNTGELSRTYSQTYTFDESGLEIVPED